MLAAFFSLMWSIFGVVTTIKLQQDLDRHWVAVQGGPKEVWEVVVSLQNPSKILIESK